MSQENDGREPCVMQARRLSSGTIGSLTGLKWYTTIDRARDEFVAYCRRHSEFKDWRLAWKSFAAQRKDYHGTCNERAKGLVVKAVESAKAKSSSR